MKFHCLIMFMPWLLCTINMHSNMNNMEVSATVKDLKKKDKNRKLRNQNVTSQHLEIVVF